MNWLKTISTVLLTGCLMVATTGMTLNKHYCMGRLKAVSINHSSSCQESGEEASDPMPCCEDVSQELKVEEMVSATFDWELSFSKHLLFTHSFLPTVNLKKGTHWVGKDTHLFLSPPLVLKTKDSQSAYQVFRI